MAVERQALRGREVEALALMARTRGARSLEFSAVDGLMMDFPLTLPHLLRRAETYFGEKEIVTRLPDKSFHRYTYADMARRAKQLAVALRQLGLEPGDRVATLCWNHYQHTRRTSASRAAASSSTR